MKCINLDDGPVFGGDADAIIKALDDEGFYIVERGYEPSIT